MENNVIDAVSLGGSVTNVDFSIWALFLKADVIVKAVIVILLVASLWCWAIIFDKWLGLRRLNSSATEFESVFWSGGSLDQLYDRIGSQPHDPMSAVFVAAMKEWRRVPAVGGMGSLSQRIERVMQITLS
ncbi:MAG: Tol-Pal system subunit TolQ, partial [Rhodospirillales bacterium]